MFKIPVIFPIMLLFLLMNFSGLLAQIKGQEYKPLSCSFTKSEQILGDEGTITNVLMVKNNNGITREFYLEVTLPTGWKTMNSSNKLYKLDPDDSLFIPVRIIPNKILMKGSTKYNINVLVVGTDGKAHAICSFFAGKPRKTDWDISVLPRSRIYFLNGQDNVPLSLYVANKGEEDQQLNVSWNFLGRGIGLMVDSVSNKSFIDLKISKDNDTTINLTAKINKQDLNYSKIDIESYNPFNDFESRKYRINFKAVEPFYRQEKGIKNLTPFGFQEGKENPYRPQSGGVSKSVNADLIKLSSSVDFVKLSNKNYLNPNNGVGSIPIIWYSNLFNVLGMQPMWSNTFISKFSPKDSITIYSNIQHFFTFYSPSRQTYQNLQGNIFLTSPKIDLNVGQGATIIEPLLSNSRGFSNVSGSGIGISYKPINAIKLGAFFNQAPLFSLNPTNRNYGLSISYLNKSNRFNTALGYTLSEFLLTSRQVHTITTGFNYKINIRNQIRGNITYVNSVDSIGSISQSSRDALNWFFSYNGSFFNNKLSQSITASYFNIFLPNNAFNTNIFVNNNTRWQGNRFGIQINNSASYNRSIRNNQIYQILQIPSNLNFWFKNRGKISFIPNLFHVFVTDYNASMHQTGLSLNTSNFNYEKNLRFALNFRGAYNFFKDSINYSPIFNANAFFMIGYRTYGANIGYSYGHNNFGAVKQFLNNPTTYPQFIFVSLNKQHVFPRFKQFVFDFTTNYSWNNITYAHNFSISPIVYFFSKKGWRFNASLFYNLNARNPELSRQFYVYQGTGIQLPEVEPGLQYANNFNLQFGLRKEFGILLPKKWRKNFYSNPTFIAFLDFNGNRIKDKDEVALENMVIQLNGHEAITDKEGKCQFINVEQKRYFFNVIPLTDIDGWFSFRKDSVDITPSGVYYVPFTKGVKIEGTVLLDREKFTEDILGELDLSKIRIFTTDTSGNTYSTLTDRKGNFSFYVPFGFYALSMDESVVSDRFIIAQNNIPLELEEGIESYYQAFFIIEKRRRVKKKKFNEKGELVFVEEVENNEGRPNKNKKVKDANEELGIFNETRRNGSVKKDSTELWRMNYEELDKRILRLDSIINELKDKSVQGNANNNNSQGFNQVVLMDALKKLKDEEERNTPYFIVQVASLPKGQTAPADILDKYNSGTLRTLDDGANTIYYFGSKFTDVDKAVDAVGVAAKNKIGKPELKVQFKGKVMTLNDYKDANK